MNPDLKSISATVLRQLVVLLLLEWPQIGSTAGTWSVISLPQKPGGVLSPTSVTVDAAGNLYVVDEGDGRIQQRDAHGNWSVVIATSGWQVEGLAADTAGNLYVANYSEIQKRNAQGDWSVIAPTG